MPIIDHNERPMPCSTARRRVRTLIGKQDGAIALTMREVIMHPGDESPLHTHPADQATVVLEGSIQMFVAGEVRTVRSGHTLLAPPGVPHKLVNNTWVAARMLEIHATDDPVVHNLE